MIAADLFSGLGGTSEGITQAGGQVAWVANHNPAAIDWHRRNHPLVTHYEQDLSEIEWTQVEAPEYLHASPACQGFSQNGKPAEKRYGNHVSIARKRNRNTAYAVLAAADVLRPRVLTVENVQEMATEWAGFPAWCAMLEAFGYCVETQVLNPLDFGGSQDRPRLVVTARQGSPLRIEPTNAPTRSIGDCLGTEGLRWRPVAKASDRMRWRIRKAQSEAGSNCFWANVSESRGRSLDEPWPTSTTKSGSQWCIVDGDQIRVINPRELARSMSFPDSYEIPSNRGLASLLIGNAMDCRLAEAVARQVA